MLFHNHLRRFAQLVILALVAFIGFCPPILAQNQVVNYGSNSPSVPLKVLFIGNSFTYLIPEIFAGLAESDGRQAKVSMAAYPSYSLEEHLRNPSTMSALTQGGPWDYVVLQERSHFPVAAQAKMEQACVALDRKIRATGAKTVLMMTWANEGEGSNQAAISGEYRKIGNQLNATVVPVGDMFWRVGQSNPSLYLYGSDKHHANTSGSYLAACMLYGQLVSDARRVPVGIERSLNMSDSTVERLRNFASGTMISRSPASTPMRSGTGAATRSAAGGTGSSGVPFRLTNGDHGIVNGMPLPLVLTYPGAVVLFIERTTVVHN